MTERRDLPLYEAGGVEVPWVIGGFDEVVERDTEWGAHSHPTHELSWNARGASTVTVEARTWTITPAIGLWMPAGMLHSGAAPAGTWYHTAHFGVTAVRAISDAPVAVAITPLLRMLLERLRDPQLTASSRELTEAMVIDVLAPSDHELLVHAPAAPLLQPIVAAVRRSPGDPRTLEDWAREVGVSPRTITRAFQAETGHGYLRWVAAVRAQRAVALLGQGRELDAVAGLVGYASVSAFGAAFRRATGLTPSAFRIPLTLQHPGVRNATCGVGTARLRRDACLAYG